MLIKVQDETSPEIRMATTNRDIDRQFDCSPTAVPCLRRLGKCVQFLLGDVAGCGGWTTLGRITAEAALVEGPPRIPWDDCGTTRLPASRDVLLGAVRCPTDVETKLPTISGN